jgi:hypothetical protein
LFLAAGWITLACVGNFANALYLDKLGRIRSLRMFFYPTFNGQASTDSDTLVIGISGCVICVIVEAAIVANYGASNNKSALAAGVAMLFIYICL